MLPVVVALGEPLLLGVGDAVLLGVEVGVGAHAVLRPKMRMPG